MVSNQWDTYAELFNKGIGASGDSLHTDLIDPIIFSFLKGVKNATILDGGCGNGYLLKKLVQGSRNIRSSGCSGLDCAYVADGKWGGAIVQTSKIWDNAASYLIIAEAGGVYTTVDGASMELPVTRDTYTKNFTYIAAAPQFHQQLLDLHICS